MSPDAGTAETPSKFPTNASSALTIDAPSGPVWLAAILRLIASLNVEKILSKKYEIKSQQAPPSLST